LARRTTPRANHRHSQNQPLILSSLIDKYATPPSPVFAAFLDASKAFDLVDRPTLWTRLHELGLSGRVLAALESVYRQVSFAMRGDHGEASAILVDRSSWIGGNYPGRDRTAN
jgi:hypothetical protein